MKPALRAGGHFGPYLIESRLGAGGMGVVFVAVDTRLDRRVALKVMTGDVADDETFQARFQREAATLARVDSPHIVTIFEHGEHDGVPFIATQLVAGGDLGSLLDAGPPLSIEATRSVGAQLAEALHDAHGAGVVHRDVKPANVLVRDRDADALFVYLCDFGIAKTDAEGITTTGAVAGSFPFISPERLDGQEATPASDVYSLGCVLWACLTGSAPYSGSFLQLAHAHATAPVPQLAGDDPETQEMNRLLARSMAKSPDQRFGSAAEMLAALNGTADDVTVPRPWNATRGPGPVDEPKPRLSRTLVMAAIAALVVLLGSGALALSLTSSGSGDDEDAPETTTTTEAPETTTTTDGDYGRDDAIAELTGVGLTQRQAECVVDEIEEQEIPYSELARPAEEQEPEFLQELSSITIGCATAG